MGIFSFFSKKDPITKLEIEYKKLLKESFDLSKVDRTKSDAKLAEAEEIAAQIEKLKV